MRRSLLLAVAAGTVALTGCEALKEAFSPQSNVVAAVDKHKLETDRLVKLAGQIPGGTINADGVEFLGTVWVNLQLFAKARVGGTLKDDSATVARVMWPQILQARIQAWQDTLAARRPKPTDASADSAYDAGVARVFQHIIVVPGGGKKEDTVAARARITGILAQVRKGGDFGKLAANNADASKSDAGYLPVGPRGQFVKEFEDAAWALEPGKVSEVVQSPFGFHLIRRPPKEEARKRFGEYLLRSGAQRADSAYVFGLAKSHGLKLQADAAKAIRDAAKDLDAAKKSSRKLITYSNGAFTVGDFARWMEALPQGASRQIAMQPDSVLNNFIEGLGQNVLVVQQIDSAKVPVPVATWQALQLSFRAMTDQMAAAMNLNDPAVKDSTKPLAARLDSAAARVDAFLEQLVAGKAQFRPLPPPLVGYLRETGTFRFNRAGLTRAVELVTAKVKADSAKGVAPQQPGPMQPAPGGPPVQAPPAGAQKEQPKKP